MLPLSCRLLLDFPVLSEDGKTEMSRAVSGRVSRPDREQVLRLQALPPRGEMRGNLPRPSVSKFDSLSLSAFFLRKKRKGKGREEEGGRVVSHLAGFLHRYSYLSRRCVTKDECVKMNRLRRVYYVLEDGLAWRPFNGSCVTHCPDGYEDALDENNVRFTKKSPSLMLVKASLIRIDRKHSASFFPIRRSVEKKERKGDTFVAIVVTWNKYPALKW